MKRNPDIQGMKVPGWIVTYCRENYSRLVAAGFDMDSRPIGCGYFGCVFPYKPDDRYVAKLTRDPAEAEAARRVIRFQSKDNPGFDGVAKFKSVSPGPSMTWRGSKQPTFLIIRERVDAFTEDDIPKLNKKTEEARWALMEAKWAASDYVKHRSAASREVDYGTYMEAAARVGRMWPYVGQSLAATMSLFGYPLMDVHFGNIGRRTVNWGGHSAPPGSIIIFDLGYPELRPS